MKGAPWQPPGSGTALSGLAAFPDWSPGTSPCMLTRVKDVVLRTALDREHEPSMVHAVERLLTLMLHPGQAAPAHASSCFATCLSDPLQLIV